MTDSPLDWGRWLEAAGLIGFVVFNVVVVFVALWWGLGRDKPAPPRAHQDQGRMTAEGVPYVPGPQPNDQA